MKAREVMTTKVVSVGPDRGTRDVARILIDKGISAVPVVDDEGRPIGIVSEGDLIGHDEPSGEARRDWWLVLLAEGEMLHPDFLASLRTPDRLVRDVMVKPVVSVEEDTEVGEIARLLVAHRVKRAPWYVKGGLSASSAVPISFGCSPKKHSKPTLQGGGMPR